MSEIERFKVKEGREQSISRASVRERSGGTTTPPQTTEVCMWEGGGRGGRGGQGVGREGGTCWWRVCES